MARLPLGVSRLDAICGGGAPAGSVILLAGEPGAGAREFLTTAAVVNGLAHSDRDRFDLTYGRLPDAASVPDEIHYVSLTAAEAALEQEWRRMFDPAIVAAGWEAINVADLAAQYLSGTGIPSAWYANASGAAPMAQSADDPDLLGAITDYLDTHAPGSLVAIDSLTALGTLPDERVSWGEIAVFLRGLRRATEDWDGLVLLLLNPASLPQQAFGRLSSGVDGTFRFEWASGGHEIDRTMVIEKFRGVLPTIDADDIVRFETEIDGSGFKLSEVRKIR